MVREENAVAVRHEVISGEYRLLELRSGRIAETAQPGQFVHVKVPALEASALMRPFSIFDVEDDLVRILYKTVGRGTKALNGVNAGDVVTLIGPLGKGFPFECEGRALLVGGGYGTAPLYFLAKRLAGERCTLFAGGRTAGDLLALDKFASLGVEVFSTTNDGSAGVKGFVTAALDPYAENLKKNGEKFSIYACGPDGMLKAVAERACALGVPGWISMDRHMICGVGACFACIQKTVCGNARCCADGPVFHANELVLA